MQVGITELKPTSQKSYYGKALLISEDNMTHLCSYDTRVASYNHNTNAITIYGYYSKTTAKHINDFLAYFGFDHMNKKEMQNFNINQ